MILYKGEMYNFYEIRFSIINNYFFVDIFKYNERREEGFSVATGFKTREDAFLWANDNLININRK